MLNPMRSDLEQVLFPNEQAVGMMLCAMDLAYAKITEMKTSDDAAANEIICRNVEFIIGCMSYEAIQRSGGDLSKFVALTS